MNGSFETIKNKQIEKILQREEEFDFPQLLSLLRQTMGLNRKAMSRDCNIPEFLIFNWEKGNFKRSIKERHLLVLADYYQVPFHFLLNKMQQYQVKKEN